MYDFKHHNDIETYNKIVKKEKSLNRVRDILFLTLLILLIFMAGVFSLKSFQEYHKNQNRYSENSSKISSFSERENFISHMRLTDAIKKSVVKNIQTQNNHER